MKIGRLDGDAPEDPSCDDESAGIRDVGVDRKRLVRDEMGIGGNGELEFTVDVIEVAKRHVAHVRAAVA